MKGLKRIFALMLAVSMIFTLAACGENNSDVDTPSETTTDYVREIKTKVAVMTDATGLGLAKLSEDRSYAYEVKEYSSADEIASLIKNGEADIAAVSADVAAKLYNETKGGIKILAVNSCGFIYALQNGKNIVSYDDLEGKTIYASGKGTFTEFVINRVLTQKELVPGKDITVEYKDSTEELVKLATEGEIDLCILPEPFATKVIADNQDCSKLIDFRKAWKQESDSELVQGVVIARTDYINENPEIISEFMIFNEVSVNYLSANPEVSANFLTEKGWFDVVEIAYVTIPASNIVYMEGEEMKTAVKTMYEIINAENPELIGGAIPDDGIYYIP